MNREIKFRAWNGKEILHNFVVVRPQASDCLSIMTDEKFAERTYKLKEWKIMQFTGLKDRNGKEIYEGDILKADKEWFEIGSDIGIVGFSRGQYCVHDNEWDNTDYITNREVEIVGNIYVNSELLK